MRKFMITVAVGACLAAVGVAQTPAPKTGADPVVIRAGEIQITQSEFEAAIKTIPAEYQAYASGPGKKAFAEDYLRMRLLARAAEKRGLEKDPEVVRQLRLLRENALANAELDRLEKGIQVSDADVQKAYDAKKGTYEQVKARHILIAYKGSPAAQPGKKELTEEEAKAKADDIRKKVAGGGDFAELARTESDDKGSGARGGELGTFAKGQMVPEFEKVAFETKPGEVSPVVRTQFGYHVIKVDEHKTQALAEVKPQLEREIRQTKMQEQMDQMKNNSAAIYDETYFAPPAPPAPAQSSAPAQNPADAKAKPQTSDVKKPQ